MALTDKSQIALNVHDLRLIEGTPRFNDGRVALRLDLDRRKWRELIKRHEQGAMDRGLGNLSRRGTNYSGPGRPTDDWWLTIAQTIYYAAHSETKNADDVIAEVALVVEALRTGAPIPDTPWTDALFAPERPTIERGPDNVVHVRHEPIQRGLFDGDDRDDTIGRGQWHSDAKQERPRTTWTVSYEGVDYAVILEWAWGGCPTQLSIGRENDSALLVLPTELRTITGRGEPLLLNVDRGVPVDPILQAYSYFPHGPFSCNAIATIEHFFDDPNILPWERSL
jgi:hypothetical protein